ALRVGEAWREPLPRGARVFADDALGRQRRRAATEAAIVDAKHREAELMQALHSLRAAAQIPARAMEVEQHGSIGARLREPQRVQLDRRAGLGRVELDPAFLQTEARFLRARRIVRQSGLEDPL